MLVKSRNMSTEQTLIMEILPTEFTLFPKLPTEIRLKVWQ
jgi:hypothetical protein